jgi:Arabinose efflux permease
MGLMPPIFFIALGLFGVYCIEFGVVGILPLIIARYGISTAQAGWLVGIFALTIALLGPLLVLLASRFNRKRMLLIALTVFAAASALSAQVDSFAMLMLLRIVPALFHPIYFHWPWWRPRRFIRRIRPPKQPPMRSSAPAWAWCWGYR